MFNEELIQTIIAAAQSEREVEVAHGAISAMRGRWDSARRRKEHAQLNMGYLNSVERGGKWGIFNIDDFIVVRDSLLVEGFYAFDGYETDGPVPNLDPDANVYVVGHGVASRAKLPHLWVNTTNTLGSYYEKFRGDTYSFLTFHDGIWYYWRTSMSGAHNFVARLTGNEKDGWYQAAILPPSEAEFIRAAIQLPDAPPTSTDFDDPGEEPGEILDSGGVFRKLTEKDEEALSAWCAAQPQYVPQGYFYRGGWGYEPLGEPDEDEDSYLSGFLAPGKLRKIFPLTFAEEWDNNEKE